MAKLRLLSLEGLLEMKLNEEPFQLAEVLSADQYRDRHIPGEINLPLEELAKTAGSRLKPGMTVVVYCGKYSCPASTNAARKLLFQFFLLALSGQADDLDKAFRKSKGSDQVRETSYFPRIFGGYQKVRFPAAFLGDGDLVDFFWPPTPPAPPRDRCGHRRAAPGDVF
jgi:rhodanese-related sulfurtransferase